MQLGSMQVSQTLSEVMAVTKKEEMNVAEIAKMLQRTQMMQDTIDVGGDEYNYLPIDVSIIDERKDYAKKEDEQAISMDVPSSKENIQDKDEPQEEKEETYNLDDHDHNISILAHQGNQRNDIHIEIIKQH